MPLHECRISGTQRQLSANILRVSPWTIIDGCQGSWDLLGYYPDLSIDARDRGLATNLRENGREPAGSPCYGAIMSSSITEVRPWVRLHD